MRSGDANGRGMGWRDEYVVFFYFNFLSKIDGRFFSVLPPGLFVSLTMHACLFFIFLGEWVDEMSPFPLSFVSPMGQSIAAFFFLCPCLSDWMDAWMR